MKQWMWSVALAAAVLAGSATAASAQGFDCDRASTRVERMICADPALRELDGEMSWTFTQVTDVVADRAALQRDQRAWLAERNACVDAACLTQIYRRRVQSLVEAPRAGWTTYRNETLGIAFDHLENRRVAPCPYGDEPCVALYGPAQGQDTLLIAFEVVNGELEATATAKAGFEYVDGVGWRTTYGRFLPQTVMPLVGPGWRGMEATVTCGISDEETGFHAAGGECYYGVMSNGRRAVVATTEGLVDDDEATRRSVTSLRFLP